MAAIGDVHCSKGAAKKMNKMFNCLHERAEVLLLCGDLTDLGQPDEMEILLAAIYPSIQAGLQVISVLGNHDYHSGQSEWLVKMMREAGVHVLYGDDNIYVLNERVGFVGVKGGWGGFGHNTLFHFGEPEVKQIVTETVTEVKRLTVGLHSLQTPQKVVVMHYAPIKETLRGEHAELMITLGAEWLAAPLDQEGATIVFHGHAHHGAYNGLTKTGIPVYNVATPVLRRTGLQTPCLHLI
jgi:Icc-related predicted phosphoesterase